MSINTITNPNSVYSHTRDNTLDTEHTPFSYEIGYLEDDVGIGIYCERMKHP
jgi:hypothetical protein